jgi:hypothetical protein
LGGGGEWRGDLCQPNLTIEKVCRSAEETCRQMGRSVSCWDGYADYHSCESDRELLQTHRTALSYASRKFYEFLRNPEIQSHCCGNNKYCKQGFISVKLMILRGLPSDDYTAYYSSVRNRVFASVSKIVRCTSRACVDRMIFHELGHACSRWHTSIAWNPVEGPRRDFDYSQAFRNFTSPEAARCISQTLHVSAQSAQARGINVERNSWNEEALANLIFISNFDHPAHWAGPCSTLEDHFHPRERWIANCTLLIPRVRATLCRNRH